MDKKKIIAYWNLEKIYTEENTWKSYTLMENMNLKEKLY